MPLVNPISGIAGKIKRYRYYLLVHSCLYYETDIALVSDDEWSKVAVELSELQTKYPDIAESVIFSEGFKEFDGSSGFDLPYRDAQIVNIAARLLRYTGNDIDELLEIAVTGPEYKGGSKQIERRKGKETKVRKRLF